MTVTDTRPGTVTSSDDWQRDALCGKVADPDMFFPPKGVSADEARELCIDHCPVRYDCLAATLERGEREGVRGGYAERERRPLHLAYRKHFKVKPRRYDTE